MEMLLGVGGITVLIVGLGYFLWRRSVKKRKSLASWETTAGWDKSTDHPTTR